jgi:hypothetical protein
VGRFFIWLIAASALLAALAAPSARAQALPADIEAFFTAYQAAWNEGRMDALETFWDGADPAPLYQAEEEAQPATTWPAVRDYWRRTGAMNERIIVRYANFRLKTVTKDEVMVLFDMRWDLKLKTLPRPIGGENRTVASLRRTPQGWRMHAWVEAPLAPITYVRKLYMDSVPPETARALAAPR